MKNELTITLSGSKNITTTRLLIILNVALVNMGFVVKIEPTSDYKDTDELFNFVEEDRKKKVVDITLDNIIILKRE